MGLLAFTLAVLSAAAGVELRRRARFARAERRAEKVRWAATQPLLDRELAGHREHLAVRAARPAKPALARPQGMPVGAGR
jgi:hypothetical protein